MFFFFFSILASLIILTTVATAQLPSSLGWHTMTNTKIDPVCAATHGFPSVAGAESCPAILSWSSGALDTTRNRLIVWGGGHNAYYGNEIYYVDLDDYVQGSGSQQMIRLTNPTTPVASSCVSGIPSASPTAANSRHTYDGIEYHQGADLLWVSNGAMACAGGNGPPGGFDMWVYHFSSGTWDRVDEDATYVGGNPNPTGSDSFTVGNTSAYDPVTDLIYFNARQTLNSYNPDTNTVTRVASITENGYHMSASIDWKRRLYVQVGFDSTQGAGRVYTYDLTTGARTTRSTTGCGGIIGDTYIGIDYEPNRDRMVMWNGGNTLYLLNLDTNTCITETYSGGQPVSAQGRGTHGRFRYSDAHGGFIVYNETDSDAQFLRITPVADWDFSLRCRQPGVLACYPFDTAADISGGYQAGANGTRGFLDTSDYASGGGALRFELRSGESGANIAGSYTKTSAPWGFTQGFGQDSTFYVQYRTKISATMLSNLAAWNSVWKEVIFHEGNVSCGGMELTHTHPDNGSTMYTDCGGRHMYTATTTPDHTENTPLLWQQDWDIDAGGPPWNREPGGVQSQYPTVNWEHPADVWVTKDYKIHVGTLTESGTSGKDSTVEMWETEDGEVTRKKIISVRIALAYNDASNDTYNNFTLTPYMTSLSTSAGSDAFMRFDELIISTQAIPLPGILSSGVIASVPGVVLNGIIAQGVSFP